MLFAGQIKKKLGWLFWAVFGLSSLYSIFSYSLTDPNLILTSWPTYWNFQQWMWEHFFNNHQLLVRAYTLLIVAWFAVYFWGLKILSGSKKVSPKQFFGAWLLAISPLLLSYNALSHDVFNYIFNAKIVLVYQANPHVSVALDFVRDDWTRFMHNTHTPAPYGYGWTGLSLIPYAIGFHKFLPTWLIFRLFSVLSVGALLMALQKLAQQLNKTLSLRLLWLVFFNPLLIIEVVSNQHNDLWMLAPAMASLWLVAQKPKKHLAVKTIASGLLLAASISIKLATAVLLPIWLVAVLRWFGPTIRRAFSWEKLMLLSSVALFVPLFTERSQQFLPWYLLWSLVWLPLIKERWWRAIILVFSFTAMLRYIPWLKMLDYTDHVLLEQKWVLWGGGLVLWVGWYLWHTMRYNKS